MNAQSPQKPPLSEPVSQRFFEDDEMQARMLATRDGLDLGEFRRRLFRYGFRRYLSGQLDLPKRPTASEVEGNLNSVS